MKHLNYDKINTLYKRNMQGSNKGSIIIGDYATKEIEYLKDCQWIFTEKIDGTNIGVRFDGSTVEFQGRTENADIPKHLLLKLKDIFTADKLYSVFVKDPSEPVEVVVFGEGYGKKIQKGGNYIPDDVDFILFDIYINGWWLNRESLEDAASKLNIKIVPLIGVMSIEDAENMVKGGFYSTISDNKQYIAEGLVGKPIVELKNKKGDRVMVKIKHADYAKLNGIKHEK